MVQVSEVADSVFVLLSLSPTSARELKSCIQMALRSLKCFTSKAVAQDVASGACSIQRSIPIVSIVAPFFGLTKISIMGS